MNALVLLAIFVGIVFLIGYLAETHAHKSPKEPLEDLRVSYAPDLLQVFKDQVEHEQKEKQERRDEEFRRERERFEQYRRELQDAKIKRWLEGNPVTYGNPLTEREQPIPPTHMMGHWY